MHADVQFVDPSYELIGCSAEARLVDHISPTDSDCTVANFYSDPEEATRVEDVRRRLAAHPREPAWPVVGYDIASFGDLLSMIGCIDVEETLHPEHRGYLNDAGLFPGSEVASMILNEDRTLSEFDGREYFVFRVLVPPATW